VASAARIWRRCARLPAPGRPPRSALGAREALALLLGHGLPAAQTARDFLEAFDQAAPPLWQGEKCHVPGEGERLQGLAQAKRRLIGFLQERRPQALATLDVDATILESQKRAARWTYDGRTGFQPVVALWAEQDVILADEFRDGNVPAGTGNRRVIEQALAALPAGIGEVRLRGDSALYEQTLLRWLDGKGIGYAISADMSHELAAAIRTPCPRAPGRSSARTATRSGTGPRCPMCRATGWRPRTGRRRPAI
jgi:Transposase DDE domain group 1